MFARASELHKTRSKYTAGLCKVQLILNNKANTCYILNELVLSSSLSQWASFH